MFIFLLTPFYTRDCKHHEITFPHEFICMFTIGAIIGVKKSCQKCVSVCVCVDVCVCGGGELRKKIKSGVGHIGCL